MKLPRGQFPADITPKPGLVLTATQPDGSTIDVVITGVTDDEVTLDANHPLAGKDLTFAIELVAVD
jgi:peptidylprolyl isomerase